MNFTHLIPKPHPQTAGRVVDGEAVLILADTSEINVLNQVGSRIFELANGAYSVGQIGELIAAEYDISREQATQDVAAFLREMVEQQVMIFADAGEA